MRSMLSEIMRQTQTVMLALRMCLMTLSSRLWRCGVHVFLSWCLRVCVCATACVCHLMCSSHKFEVVISRAFFFFRWSNHITNIKKKSFSGEAKDSVNFSFFILLHKRAKPRPLRILTQQIGRDGDMTRVPWPHGPCHISISTYLLRCTIFRWGSGWSAGGPRQISQALISSFCQCLPPETSRSTNVPNGIPRVCPPVPINGSTYRIRLSSRLMIKIQMDFKRQKAVWFGLGTHVSRADADVLVLPGPAKQNLRVCVYFCSI